MHIQRPESSQSNLFTTWLPILVGLSISQVIATAAVFQSNRYLYAVGQAIEAEGYLFIPTGPALQSLAQISSAFWGGLFFTLSIGAGLTLAAWAAIFIWSQAFHRDRKLMILFVAVWALMLIWINFTGVSFLPTLFILAIPAATAWTTDRWLKRRILPPFKVLIIPLVVLMLLTALWATAYNKNIFVSIRDHILLSNAAGRMVNDFYYRYTLYAAEVFKSFNQKTIHTYQWSEETDPRLERWMEQRMLQHDVIHLNSIDKTDLMLSFQDGRLGLSSPDGVRFEIPLARFHADPSAALNQYSRMTDELSPLRSLPGADALPEFHNPKISKRVKALYTSLIRSSPFRLMTMYGLLIGFPILLYVTVYSTLRTALGYWLDESRAIKGASAICMVAGILLFLPMLNVQPMKITKDNLGSALSAKSWPVRVAALRFIERHKLDISIYPQHKPLVISPLMVERYWLARAMATSRTASTYADLTTLMKDPHPNVVCQAYYALGQRKAPNAVPLIHQQIRTSNHWYTQWYGYRALRSIGWRQRQLK